MKEKAQLYKVCSRCRNILPTSEFSKNNSRSDGLQSLCNACRRRRYVEQHPSARLRIDEMTTEMLLSELERRGVFLRKDEKTEL